MATRNTIKKKVEYKSEHAVLETKNKTMPLIPKLDLSCPSNSKKKTNRKLKNSSTGNSSLSKSADENAPLRASLQKLDDDHRRMQHVLENTVAEAEERLEEMKKLLEKRDQLHNDQMDEITKKNLNLEDQVSKYEKHLLSCNTDPVNLQMLEPTSDNNEATEERRKFSKTRVKQMRERLRHMNEQTSTFLADMQNMKHQLQELEDMGSRISRTSDDEDDDFPGFSGFRPDILQAAASVSYKTQGSGDDVPLEDDDTGTLFITQNHEDPT
ncbi:uncharacterized protein LOC121372305 [Gigantopelta aegis]|uniref:uncharacterized protein LOC121372305 n=1 Tax=Gigantopelta aegis TaxID=1735272 RepID=UPI001B88B639|nr:uncharacterized protein LOC121372305 [Gigantopelta aegis]